MNITRMTFILRKMLCCHMILHNSAIMITTVLSSGESYAGIYVPTLVHLIMEMNEKLPPENRLNLKGFAVSIVNNAYTYNMCIKITIIHTKLLLYIIYTVIIDNFHCYCSLCAI